MAPITRPVDTSREYMMAKDVAAHLTISLATVWRRSKDGTLPPPVRIGSATRWRRVEIEAAMQQAE